MTTETKAGEPSWDELKPQLIKMALELGPLVVFFIVNAKGEDMLAAWPALTQWFSQPIIFATAVFMALLLGSLVGLGVTLLGGLAFGQSLLKYVFGEVYKLEPKGWHILTLRWGLFFIFLAVLNEVVWRTQSTDFWVAFKVWATMPITIIFAGLQLPVLSKYAPRPIKPVEAITPIDPLP